MKENHTAHCASLTGEELQKDPQAIHRTLKINDSLSFTAPIEQNLQTTLLQQEKTAPHVAKKELSSLPIQEENNSPHHFLYPSKITLKNKYGIMNYRQLQIQCAHDSARASINLRQEAPPENLTSAYLLYIHHTLFKNTFEWAGKTRDKPFTFSDGTVACMPKMQKANIFFARGEEIQEGLKKLDQTLTQKNNLKGLSREEFIEQAAELMIQLNYTHPFREGNGRTQRLFFEKLGQIAGHKLDFSLITTERMKLASIASLKSDDSEPMKSLFEDISHPQKTFILKEFMDHMKNIGLENISHRLVMSAKEGEIYRGFYRGSGANGFMMDVNGTFIIGNKEHLTPEQVKTLKIGDPLCFTTPSSQEQEMLIPTETIASLTIDEIIEKIQNNTQVQESKKKIERLSQNVYGHPHILQNKMPTINTLITHKKSSAGENFAWQIREFPTSISQLAGFKIWGIKSATRVYAEENISSLCLAISDYTDAVEQAEKKILHHHTREQERCKKSIAMPPEKITNLLSLCQEQQQETLLKSAGLGLQTKNYIRALYDRLSATEHKAIKENNYQELAKTIGTSENKAKKIIKIVTQAKGIEQALQSQHFYKHQFYDRQNLSPHHSITQNTRKHVIKNRYSKTFNAIKPNA
ncbi:BID domain-containing T4SS effector [Bartonella florencae]|uniref:BID domain-containing T4SS effector n=1 Tax=Bartonella florencae TaxID=928210 RepID=UPI0002E12394|nr:BID domain-containing T4SS effector [Bartonella florencae]